jgi:dihydrofolate synthase/folylpolyglutamate synthase
MLRDKDIGGVLREMAPHITRWHLASLTGPRAASASELAMHLKGAAQVHQYASPAQAFAAAREAARENDKIVVFGSFLTVGEITAWLNNNKTSTR